MGKFQVGDRIVVVKNRYWKGCHGEVIGRSNGRQYKSYYAVKLDGSLGSRMMLPAHELIREGDNSEQS